MVQAIKSRSEPAMEDEIGDLLFSVVNLARKCNVDPESALRKTNRKFRMRFREIEKVAREKGLELEKMPLEEMDRIWEIAKDKEPEL